ncbi:hypothetical protein AAMO2058_000522600 [Amorphochlora amoebiformis]
MGSKLSLLLAICIPLQGFIFSAKKINRSWFRGHVVRHGRIPGRFSAVHGAHGREDGGVTSEDSKKRVEFQLSRGADAILEALGRIDEKTSRFQSKTGLSCPRECGRCCYLPTVEATQSEMLPLAKHIVSTGESDFWLEKASKAGDTCVFFLPGENGKGRCMMYTHRPSLCRLFGFSSRTNKSRDSELIKCQHMDSGELKIAASSVKSRKALAPDVASEARMAREAGLGFTALESQVPEPINKAFLAALNKFQMEDYYMRLELDRDGK